MTTHTTSTVFVRNLPQEVTSEQVEDIFSDIGPIKRCFVVKQKGTDKGRGFGYVTFSLQVDADHAVSEGKLYEGRKLLLKYADRKQRPEKGAEKSVISPTAPPTISAESKKKSKIKKKLFKLKKHRLIVRNLSFKASEEDVRTQFEAQGGKVVDVNIPVKADGKKRGFCFVQFENIASAAAALKQLNGCEVKGRKVAVDWAVSKQQYGDQQEKETKSDDENSESDSSDVEAETEQTSPTKHKKGKEDAKSPTKKRKKDEEINTKVKKLKMEDSKTEKVKQKSKKVVKHDSDNEDSSIDLENESESESETESDSDNVQDESDSAIDSEGENEKQTKPQKQQRKDMKKRESDVAEGRTIFARNVPYDTDEFSLEDCFSQWGEVDYARIVMDRATNHSKGTAFIKFATPESAQKCLADCGSTPLVMDSRTIAVFPAMKPTEAAELAAKDKDKKKQKDDNKKDGGRNLWLARVGSIREGTQEATSLNPSDVLKRAKIDAVKRQKLKSPNIFVSTTRLCVHNIPVTCDNKKLKGIFLKAAGDKTAEITECRIMCDMERVNTKGVPKSRGYGFINFTTHQHALEALNKTNNSAEIFDEKKKLIVEFSLENRMALAAREKRMERIQVKHAMLKGEGKRATYTKVQQQKKDRREKRGEERITAPQKGTMAQPSHTGPKIRHRKKSGPQQTKKKVKKTQQQHISKVEPREKQKKNKKGSGKGRAGPTDSFDNMVAKYKAKLAPSLAGKTSQKRNQSAGKWFQ